MRNIIIFLTVLILDQGTKWIAQRYVLVDLNHGISFSFLSSPFMFPLILLGTVAALLLLRRLALPGIVKTVIFASAASNLVDRLLYGGVRDFLPVPFFSMRNNLADWILSMSLILSAYFLLKKRNKVQYTYETEHRLRR